MNLYDQLKALQTLEHAYTEWQDYRQLLTRMIINEVPLGAQLAIWGAGRCNDLDLNQLIKHCDTIWLLDKDETAMGEALKQYGLTTCKKIKTRQCDFTGIGEGIYRAYADKLVTEVRKKGLYTKTDDLVDCALEFLSHVERDFNQRVLSLGDKCYDYTVMIGVHSQLISMFDWIWQVVLQTIGAEDERVRAQIIQFNEKVIRKVNHALWQATRYEAIIGCEMGKVNQVGTIQGAIQALEDIEETILRGKVSRKNRVYLEWPFNRAQGTIYKMQLQILHINHELLE